LLFGGRHFMWPFLGGQEWLVWGRDIPISHFLRKDATRKNGLEENTAEATETLTRIVP
jgi:hypothetical protein